MGSIVIAWVRPGRTKMSDPGSLIMASARPGERSSEEEEWGAEGGRVAVVVEAWVPVGGSVVDGAVGSRVAVMMGARVPDGDRVAVGSRVAVVVGAGVAVGGSVAHVVWVEIFFLIVRHPPHRHPPHQTSTTPDIHHTVCKIRHPPHQTSTTPDIHHTRHPPHQTSTTPWVK